MMPNEMMKISELARTAGVSKQTIHFYMREGLLSPPVQTSRNMAYYDARHLDELRLIKELQEQRYLPLAVIKTILSDRRFGGDLHLPDHIAMMENAFRDAKNETDERSRTISEFVQETGLSENIICIFEAIGLLNPEPDSQGKRFDGYDAALAIALRRLLDMGMEPDDLRLYGQLLEINRAEIRGIHDRIIHGKKDHPNITNINEAIKDIRSLLAAKAKRELFKEYPPNHSDLDHKNGGSYND